MSASDDIRSGVARYLRATSTRWSGGKAFFFTGPCPGMGKLRGALGQASSFSMSKLNDATTKTIYNDLSLFPLYIKQLLQQKVFTLC